MDESKRTIKDITYVMFSNIISLTSSVINGFILPYILGATNYGYYRTFILYSTYTALLHCGFVDGILLKFGGLKFTELNKKKFRTFTSAFIIFQFIISIVLSCSSIFITNRFYSFLLIALGAYTFIFNIMTYYMFLSQTIMKFKLLSIRNTVQALLFIMFTSIIYIVYKLHILLNINYKCFIYINILGYLIMLIWYMYTYRKITFGTHYSILKKGFVYVYRLCKLGIYLTISYQISNLIMVIDNQFISSFFKASTYGKYSFSYSMVSTALTILGAVATVLLPHLQRDNFTHMINSYHIIIASMMLVVYFSLIAYFPVCLLVKFLLPKYISSLVYLKIFAPELGVTSTVTMITFNYYSALHKNKFYFYLSIIVLGISVIINTILYELLHNPLWIAFGSFISIFLWYIASEYFLIKWYHIKWLKNLIYMTIMVGVFFITSFINNLFVGFIVYLAIYVIISLFMFKCLVFKNANLLIHSFL